MWGNAVNHRSVLETYGLLAKVVPGAVVTGRQEIARVGSLVFTLNLPQTIKADTYDGFWLTVINPAVGELSKVKLSFAEHESKVATIDPLTWEQLVTAGQPALYLADLENAIAQYVAVFTA